MNYKIIENITSDNFILKMLSLGKPIETSLVGHFDEEGRGSRRDIDLPLHRDGDYSKEISSKHSIDWVGLYCIRGCGSAITIIEDGDSLTEINLKKGQAVIINNRICRHARKGKVGNRILLRVWIEDNHKQ